MSGKDPSEVGLGDLTSEMQAIGAAIRFSGPGSAPGLVATSKNTRSAPSAPRCSGASGASRVRKLARSSFKGGSSLATALSKRRAALPRSALSASAAAS